MSLRQLIDLDVIIPTYNRQLELRQTLEMVLHQELLPHKVIVVDQTPGPCRLDTELLDSYTRSGVGLVWIHRSEPNLCGARNTGIVASEASVCLVLDDDVLIPPTIVKDHWLCYQAPNSPAAVGGQVFHRRPQFPIDDLSLWDPHKGTSPAWAASTQVRKGPLFGGHFSVKRNAVHDIGGWDEALLEARTGRKVILCTDSTAAVTITFGILLFG